MDGKATYLTSSQLSSPLLTARGNHPRHQPSSSSSSSPRSRRRGSLSLRSHTHAHVQPQDLQYRLQLTFLEAVHGCEKQINFQYQKRGPDGRPEVVSRETGVDIPAGVDSGMTLQVPGQGADGDPGMPRGNLMVELRVAEDKYFKRDPRRSEDIHVEIPVTLSQVSRSACQ